MARAVQAERDQKTGKVHTNSGMMPRQTKAHCELDAEASGYLEHAMGDGIHRETALW